MAAPSVTSQTTSSARLGFGIGAGGYQDLVNAGVKPDYAQIWIGSWQLKSGWSGTDALFEKLRLNGVTPVIQFYYWGGDLTTSCYQYGCWSSANSIRKDQGGWTTLAKQLADHLWSKMQGKRAVIVLETEFNRGGIATSEAFDAGLEAKAKFFEVTYPASEVAIGFGNWGYSYWGTFDRAVKAAHYAGIQGMRASTRDPEPYYLGLAKSVLAGSQELQRRFAKPVFVSDFAVSSHWEPYWLSKQAQVLKDLMGLRSQFKSAGVVALVYRGYRDNPSAITAEYYGEAERHFGLAWSDGRAKPAFDAWKQGILAERTGTTGSVAAVSPSTPIEVERFASRPVGALGWSGSASDGKFWNLWSNGAVSNAVQAPSGGTYEVRVRAQGTLLDGRAPHMEVFVAGKGVIVADPGRYGFQDYVGRTYLGAGSYTLVIKFTNDARDSTEDRNLWLDKATLTRVG